MPRTYACPAVHHNTTPPSPFAPHLFPNAVIAFLSLSLSLPLSLSLLVTLKRQVLERDERDEKYVALYHRWSHATLRSGVQLRTVGMVASSPSLARSSRATAGLVGAAFAPRA